MVRHCAFCKLKVLHATLARAYMERNIYFLFPRPRTRSCVSLQPPAGARARLYLFIDWIVARVTKCRRKEGVRNGRTAAALTAELN